jgi:hypothetical protein
MDYNNDFRYDLKVGQVGESLLGGLLSGSITCEVKRDFWIGRTGNIAVEFESRGKPSGITTSEADYWAFVLAQEYNDEVIVFIKAERLKRIAREFYKKGSVKDMGDNNTSKAVLFPISEIINAEKLYHSPYPKSLNKGC